MKRYKKKYNIYSAWNYEQEALDLNEQSEKGWQLVKGKSFSHKYEYNPDLCYRYQLDYCPGISGTKEMVRYLDTCREQGWELVNKTFNGWYYFRKPYDPTLPKDSYELYTDRSSLKEMQRRWANLASIICTMIGLVLIFWSIRFFQQPCLPYFIGMLTFAFNFFVFLRAIFLMHNPDKPKAHKADCIFMVLFFIVLLGGSVSSCFLLAKRPYTGTHYFHAAYLNTISADKEKATCITSPVISYSDTYFLDVSINAEAPVCFSLRSDTGKVVYTVTDSDFDVDNLKLRLEKGQYKIYLSDFDGGQIDVTYRLR